MTEPTHDLIPLPVPARLYLRKAVEEDGRGRPIPAVEIVLVFEGHGEIPFRLSHDEGIKTAAEILTMLGYPPPP